MYCRGQVDGQKREGHKKEQIFKKDKLEWEQEDRQGSGVRLNLADYCR